MTKQFWINLPVKDVARSRAFFTAIGFTLDPRYDDSANSASFLIGEKNVVLRLLSEASFRRFAQSEVSDTKQATEVLLSVVAESREEVDEMAKKSVAAGGVLFASPNEHQGWMYGCGFADPDGHRWNVLYMDFAKMPKH